MDGKIQTACGTQVTDENWIQKKAENIYLK